MAEYPGEIVDQAASGLTGAVKGVVSSISGGLQGAGAQVQSAIDTPFKTVGVRAGPLRIIDAPLKGVVRAVENFINRGIVESVEQVGDGVTSGLDEIPKTLESVGAGGVGRGFKLGTFWQSFRR